MRYLITGGAGFIGSHVAERLLAKKRKVLIVDNLATGRRENVPDRADFWEHDFVNAVAQYPSEDWCLIHCAATYADPNAWTEDAHTSTYGMAWLLQNLKTIHHVIYFQTALCYGLHPPAPVGIDQPYDSGASSYAISKTAAEQYLRLSQIPSTTFRLANVFGPRNLSGPVPAFYRRLSEGKRCTVVNTRRDFVYVSDLVDLVEIVTDQVHKSYLPRRPAYHVSSGSDTTIAAMYSAVVSAMRSSGQLTGEPATPKYVERGPDDAATILLDPSETLRDFARWKGCRTPIATGVGHAVRWYQKHGVDRTYTHLKLEE